MKTLRRLRLDADPPFPTATALAEASGLNARVVQQIESGQRPISDAALIALAGQLKMTPLELRAQLAPEEQAAA